MNNEEVISYFNSLENSSKVVCTSSAATLSKDNEKSITSSVGVRKFKKASLKMWCYCCDKNNHNTTFSMAVLRQSRKKRMLILKLKLFPKKFFGFSLREF
jgi:hypothetical protein